MEPFIALVLTTAALRAAGARVDTFEDLATCLRGGLVVMFTMTGISHFVGMRSELIQMVPPFVPAPEMMVTVSGLVELAGAGALVHRRTGPWAALGLTGMLVALFPANIYWAVSDHATTWADQLVPRTAFQAAFLAATLTVARPALREVGRISGWGRPRGGRSSPARGGRRLGERSRRCPPGSRSGVGRPGRTT